MARKIVANSLLLDQVTEQLQQGLRAQIPTKGASMLPFIVGGKDTLVLQSEESYDVGDIVLARKDDGEYVLHRIVAINASQATLMGDGNIRGQELCRVENISGRVITINHKGRSIDCNSPKQRKRAHLWRTLLPLRRYIIGIWRRTPFWPI